MAPSQHVFKMAATLDVRQKQRAVIEFLCCENETVGNIHKRLKKVYGNAAVDRSTVSRWASRLRDDSGHGNIEDSPRSGRPRTAHTPDNVQRVNELVADDRRITVNELSRYVGIGEGSVCRILKVLALKKVCARWVPRMLTVAHKETRKTVCSELLEQYENGGDEFLGRIVTGDETWLHHFSPETKRQSMEWHHANSPKKTKFKTTPSAGKVMATVFFDSEGLLLVDIMPRGTTINSDAYVTTLKKLQARLSRVRPHRQKQDVLLLHDNARPHVSQKTTAVITKLGWTTLKHPPYSPDLSPCDYHLFGKLKDSLRGTRFEDDDSLVHAAKQWLQHVGPDFYRAGIQALVPRWRKAVERDGNYVEK